MPFLELLFWLCFGILFLIYLGYGFGLCLLSRFFSSPPQNWASINEIPSVCIVIPAYNELNCLPAKLANTLSLDFPFDKLSILVITDGSTDGSDALNWPDERVRLLHQAQRQGKSAAVNRALGYSDSEITVITDANTLLSPDALLAITAPFQWGTIGAVAGEKRVQADRGNSASNEGLYWKYESLVKRWDARFYTIVGAAGELFAFRTQLFKPLEPDAILDDFVLSVRIVEQGFRVAYAPRAKATEQASPSLMAEWKRKIRISAGVFQSLPRLELPFKPFKWPRAWFVFFGHRWMRWMLAPTLLPLFLLCHLCLGIENQGAWMATALLHLGLYSWALLGLALSRLQLKIPLFYTPMYFLMMNAAIVAGALRHLRGEQSVLWEKVRP